MPLKLIPMSTDGTIGADKKARVDILRDVCTFIGRMACRGVQIAIWSFHRQLLDGEPLEAYLTRESEVPVRHFHADNTKYPRDSAPAQLTRSSPKPPYRPHPTALSSAGTARFSTSISASKVDAPGLRLTRVRLCSISSSYKNSS